MERDDWPPRRIVAFHQDDEAHWVADLECGHTQHTRHDPPWQNRPWVITAEGRARFIGTTLPCLRCHTLHDMLTMDDPEIGALEERLRAAQLASNVAELDDLIADDLLFTGPDGRLYSKADDLGAHRDGVIRITAHEPQEMKVRRVGNDVAVVALLTRLAGTMGGNAFGGLVRYTRVWQREADGRWRIAAGHVSPVPA